MDYQEAIKQSRCFGVAYDSNVKECKVCEVCKLCKQKTEGVVVTPKAAPAKAEEPVEKDTEVVPTTPRPAPKTEPKADKKPAKKAKPDKNYDESMPNFTPMEMSDLLKLAKERKIDLAYLDKFPEAKTKRMRLVMKLKETYEK